MCGRNMVAGKSKDYEMVVRKDVNTSELLLGDIQSIFDQKFFNTYNLKTINMCGNRGDPATASDLFEICEYLFSMQNDLTITIATNGGLKTPAYWRKLGKLFYKYGNKSRVTFGIDGLEDTNHIYRVNVNFQKVMDNAQSFIDGGGEARWQYLLFKHNQHQLEEAKNLADQMGFSQFFYVHTPRFAHTQEGDGVKVYKWKGKKYKLETADPEFMKRKEAWKYIISEDGSDEIECKAAKNKEFYIDNGGRLIPCCWLGNSLDLIIGHNSVRDKIMSFYNIDQMNVIENDLVDTLQHNFIQEIVPMSWEHLGEDCMSFTCKSFCSKNKNIRKSRSYVN
tara:strand:- start:319 stop:1326 length:1008 start_codon:yes stop_codon:yes gene_type:complete